VPAGFKRAVNLWNNDGKLRPSKGVTFDPTSAEMIGAVLGFTPLRLRKDYDSASLKTYFDKQKSTKNQRVVLKAKELMEDGKVSEARAYLANMASELGAGEPAEIQKRMHSSLTNAAAALFHQEQQGMVGTGDPVADALSGRQTPSSAQSYLELMQTKALFGGEANFSQSTYLNRLREDQERQSLRHSNPFLPDELPPFLQGYQQ
jgi:hypothetical protein